MRVKTFTGPSTKEIMAQIKAELGPDAIILSTQTVSHEGGQRYEIMAALDDPAVSAAPEALCLNRLQAENGISCVKNGPNCANSFWPCSSPRWILVCSLRVNR